MSFGFLAESEVTTTLPSLGLPLCGACKLYKGCKSPKMPVSGQGKKGLLIIGEAPGKSEDEQNKAFVGESGRMLKGILRKHKIDIDRDCWRYNSIICRPPDNRKPSSAEIEYCRPNVIKVIKELQPKAVLLLGDSAVESVIGYLWGTDLGPLSRWVGWTIPSQDLHTWLCPTYHPAFLLRLKDQVMEDMVEGHIAKAVELLSAPLPYRGISSPDRIELVLDARKAAQILEKHAGTPAAAFDYETNMLKPEGKGSEIVTCSVAWDGYAMAFPFAGPAVKAMRDFLRSKTHKVGANIKFEERWTRAILKTRVRNWLWDTMLAAHVLDNRPGITGLKFQAFVNFGVIDYSKVIKDLLRSSGTMTKNKVRDADIRDLLLYNGLDSVLTLELSKLQRSRMTGKMCEAYRLLHAGALALSTVEKNGIFMDEEYLDSAIQKATDSIKKSTVGLTNSRIGRAWKQVYGAKTNYDSTTQLGKVLFDHLGYESVAKTPTGRPKTDVSSLEQLNIPFVKKYVALKKRKKALGTNLKGIQREIDSRGLLHTVFNVHTVKTYRSSSDSPNFQNIPVRDEAIKKLVRRAFRARPGRRLVEIDYGGIEVKVAACYHKDPNMLKYINDPSKDMHRDMAAACFKCKPNQVGKVERYCGKNMFVFPQFYGSIYPDCAKSLWEACEQLNLTIDDVPMREWLARKGIVELGSTDPKDQNSDDAFVEHIRQVENKFWNKRFPVYKQWKEDWFKQYQSKGYFDTLTGFRCIGSYRRNEVINYPVQGSAFHCLLWSLIELDKAITKKKMKTKLVGQIHDSIVADVPEDEMKDYCYMAKEIMCNKITLAWSWIIVPLEIEIEATPIGGTWYEKELINLEELK